MEHRRLGFSGLKVSRLCLGTMMFGSQTEYQEAQQIVDSARDHGVNFIDTADVYAAGACEPMVGRCIAADRNDWVLATKLGNPMGPGPNQQGQSRKWIVESVENSLRRLNTDYIDIMYLHRSFEDDGLPEAIRAMGDLIRAGKLRYFAISNFSAWRIGLVCQLADKYGIDRPVACQPVYSLADRTAEREIMSACRHYGVGVVSYSPLARGVLTGKYRRGEQPDPQSRVGRSDMRIMQTEWREETLDLATRIGDRAQGKGISVAEFAVAWVLANANVTSVIGGPRTLDQWQGYLAAVSKRTDSEDEQFVDGLIPPGHVSTHGYNDPAYPVEGRVVIGK